MCRRRHSPALAGAPARARRRQQVGHRDRRRARRAARGHRHQHRQRRADRHAELARRDAQPGELGRLELRGRQRHHPAAHGVARRSLRQEALLHLLARSPSRSRRCCAAWRPPCPMLDRRARAPGARRRRPPRQGAVDPVRDVPARGAGDGAGLLRRHRHRRPGHRPDARRLPRHQRRLALDLLHQRPGRHRRRAHVPRVPARGPTGGRTHERRRLDSAIALLAVGLGSLQTVLEEGQSEDWFDSRFIVALRRSPRSSASCCFVVARSSRRRTRSSICACCATARSGRAASSRSSSAWRSTARSSRSRSSRRRSCTSPRSRRACCSCPARIASAVAMPIAAKLARQVRPARAARRRRGASCSSALALLAQLTPQTGGDDLFWPLIIRVVRHGAHVPAAQHGDARADPEEGHLRGVGLLQPHAPARRQHRRRAPHDAARPARQAFHRAVLVEKLAAERSRTRSSACAALHAAMLAKGFDPSSGASRRRSRCSTAASTCRPR